MIAVVIVEPVRQLDLARVQTRRGMRDRHEAIGILEWQRPQHDGVEQREHGRDGADADREHEQHDGGEAGAARERTHAVSHVAL